MADFVLIHSTGQSAAGWDRLIGELDARGARGHAVDLPNDRPELRAQDYANLLADRFSGLDRPVVLAHSGSGPLLPAAAATLGAQRQVWLAAWVPHSPVTVMDDMRMHKEEAFNLDWIGQDPTVDDAVAIHFVYHDCDSETQAWALTTRRPFFPEAVYDEAIALEPSIPSTYIVALEDRTIRPHWQRRMALERLGLQSLDVVPKHVGSSGPPWRLSAVQGSSVPRRVPDEASR